jgi:hypothetical protein
MIAQRQRVILWVILVLVAGWTVALTGYFVARNAKVTPEKLAAYLRSMDLSRLSGEAREKALRDLIRQVNALEVQDRRRARLEGQLENCFNQMTEAEKTKYIEATLPSGFKQMLNAFEQLTAEKRKQAIDRTMRELARAREGLDPESGGRANQRGELSPELQKKIVNIGLKSFYNDSSAQARAELAPVVEEMQRLMQSGVLFHAHRHE